MEKITELTPIIARMYIGRRAFIPEIEKTYFLFSCNMYGWCELGFEREDGETFSIMSKQSCQNIKLILRPLTSITEEECRELYKLRNGEDWVVEKWHDECNGAKQDWWLPEDVWCIERGDFYIGDPRIWLKLLDWGFDLFGLIDAGLAWDSTQMEKEVEG